MKKTILIALFIPTICFAGFSGNPDLDAANANMQNTMNYYAQAQQQAQQEEIAQQNRKLMEEQNEILREQANQQQQQTQIMADEEYQQKLNTTGLEGLDNLQ